MVERFQNDGRTGRGVFMLSLKAGGTGLNLTAAQPRLPLRPLVEPGRREPGDRPRLPHRPDAERAGAQVRLRRHAGREDRRDDRAQAAGGGAASSAPARLADRTVERAVDASCSRCGSRGGGESSEAMLAIATYYRPRSQAAARRRAASRRSRSSGEFGHELVGQALDRRAGELRHRRAPAARPFLRPQRPGAVDRRSRRARSRPRSRARGRKPYEVTIRGVRTLAEAAVAQGRQALSRQALFAAKLLAGEMPQDIEEVFTEAALSLFPRSCGDLKTECSCPDWSNPCKHIAAAYLPAGRGVRPRPVPALHPARCDEGADPGGLARGDPRARFGDARRGAVADRSRSVLGRRAARAYCNAARVEGAQALAAGVPVLARRRATRTVPRARRRRRGRGRAGAPRGVRARRLGRSVRAALLVHSGRGAGNRSSTSSVSSGNDSKARCSPRETENSTAYPVADGSRWTIIVPAVRSMIQ